MIYINLKIICLILRLGKESAILIEQKSFLRIVVMKQSRFQKGIALLCVSTFLATQVRSEIPTNYIHLSPTSGLAQQPISVNSVLERVGPIGEEQLKPAASRAQEPRKRRKPGRFSKMAPAFLAFAFGFPFISTLMLATPAFGQDPPAQSQRSDQSIENDRTTVQRNPVSAEGIAAIQRLGNDRQLSSLNLLLATMNRNSQTPEFRQALAEAIVKIIVRAHQQNPDTQFDLNVVEANVGSRFSGAVVSGQQLVPQASVPINDVMGHIIRMRMQQGLYEESKLVQNAFVIYAQLASRGVERFDFSLYTNAERTGVVDLVLARRPIRNNELRVLRGASESLGSAPATTTEQVTSYNQVWARIGQAFANPNQLTPDQNLRGILQGFQTMSIDPYKAQLRGRLFQVVDLAPETVLPTAQVAPVTTPTQTAEVAPVTSVSTDETLESSSNPIWWILSAIGLALASIVTVVLSVRDRFFTKDEFNEPFEGRITLDLQQSSPVAQLPVREDLSQLQPQRAQIGHFTLQRAIRRTPIGIEWEVTYPTRNGGVGMMELVENGPYLIQYVPPSTLTAGEIRRVEGELAHRAYFWNGQQFQETFVFVKENYVFEAQPSSQTVAGAIYRGWYTGEDSNIDKRRPHFFIFYGDLIIEYLPRNQNDLTNPDFALLDRFDTSQLDARDKLRILAQKMNASMYWAYSFSQNRRIRVVALPMGQQVYWVTNVLGQGGMGAVYEAWDPVAKRSVAIKVTTETETEGLLRFNVEAEATAKLQHPNVVRIHKLGQGAPAHYVMEKLVGKPLDAILKERNRLNLEEALEVGIQVATGLDYMHSNGIVHRDLKPANIFWVNDGNDSRLVVNDFGLALDLTKLQGLQQEQRLTLTGEIMGTPAFMPPEQTLGKAIDIDGRADVYALGAILYKAVTGINPYAGNGLMAILSKIMDPSEHAKRVPVSRLNPNVPKELEAIIDKALSHDREDRYQTAAEMLEDLRALKGKYSEKLPSTRVAPQTKRVGMILFGVAFVLSLIVYFIFGRAKAEQVLPKQGKAQTPASAPQTPAIILTSWTQLRSMELSSAITRLSQEAGQRGLSSQDQATRSYYKAMLRFQSQTGDRASLLRNALNDVAEAIRLNPNNVQFYLLKARILAEQGLVNDARAALQEAVRKAANDEQKREAQEALRLLEQLSLVPTLPQRPRDSFQVPNTLPLDLAL